MTSKGEPEGDVGVLFHGELQLADDAESRLSVTLTMEPDSLSLATGEEKLGTWNRPEAKAVEIARGKYDLTLGNETLIFTPENGPLFASRGLPYFSEPGPESVEPAGFLAKIKKWGVRPTDFATQLGSADGEVEKSGESAGQPVGPLDAAVSGQAPAIPPTETSPSLQAAYADAVRGAAVGIPAAANPPPSPAAVPASVPASGASAGPSYVAASSPAPAKPASSTHSRPAEPARPAPRPIPVTGPLAGNIANPVAPPPSLAPPPAAPRQDTVTNDKPHHEIPHQETGATIHMTTDVRPVTQPAPATPTAQVAPVVPVAPIEVSPRPGAVPRDAATPHLPDLAGLLARLDTALRDLQEGRMEPDRGRAMAEVVRAMCRAIEVSGGGANDLTSIADKLDSGDGLGNNTIEDRV